MRFFLRIYHFYFSDQKEFTRKLYALIGFMPANIHIFKLAFSHKSNPSDKAYAVQNNERLEYLGDAVLGTIVAEYLFKKYHKTVKKFCRLGVYLNDHETFYAHT